MYKNHAGIPAYGLICFAFWTFTACASEGIDVDKTAEKIQSVLEMHQVVSDFDEKAFDEVQRRYIQKTNRGRGILGALCVTAATVQICSEFYLPYDTSSTRAGFIPLAVIAGATSGIGIPALHAWCVNRLKDPELSQRARNVAVAFFSFSAGASCAGLAHFFPEYSRELNMTGGSVMGASGLYLLTPAAQSLAAGTWALLKSCKRRCGNT